MDAAERLTAALADRYAIESEIDSGGMATVYRARDLKHERTVAIKVLRPELAEAIGADRFLREIRTTANLSHPHILPLFDSGEADGSLFYVMPFVRGESLKDRLEREGQLPVEDAVQIAREVAGALAYAHKEGVIHRDIKPANILLEEGHALLADFGIAQARAGAEETQLTQGGMSLGTPSYMSPEQVSGERELDGRADQYALGCVLYEMLAGHPPFSGADIQAVMRQHLAVDAPTVTQARATVPKGVAKAVNRALAKTPADRFRTMSELEAALAGATLPLLARIPMGRARGVVLGAIAVLVVAVVALVVVPRLGVEPPPHEPAPELVPNRVVVLPFENRVTDPDLADLGDLAATLVRDDILQLELVRAVPFEVSQGYAEQAGQEGSVDVPGFVAEHTSASLAVAGAIFPFGDSIRFQLDIIDVAAGVSFQPVVESGSPDDLEEVVNRLGDRVAGALFRKLDPDEGDYVLRNSPPLQAYRLSEQGYEAFFGGEWEEAVRLQLAAYELDTTFVRAVLAASWAARRYNLDLSDSLSGVANRRRDQLDRRDRLELEFILADYANDLPRRLRAAREQAEFDGVGMKLVVWAGAALNLNKPREALEALRDYDPYLEERGSEARFYWMRLSMAYHMLDDHERELTAAREGRKALPDRVEMVNSEVRALGALGRVEELMELLDQALVSFPFPASLDVAFQAGYELWAHGYPEAARRAFERGIEWLRGRPPEEADDWTHRWYLGFLLYQAGHWEESRAIIHALAVERPGSFYALGYEGACAARMGDTAAAREISVRLAEMGRPDSDGDYLMMRARLAALLGEPDEAMRLIHAAFSAGMRFNLVPHHDPELKSLHDREDWKELLRPKG